MAFWEPTGHMALVVDPADRVTVLGVITMEDVIEELIQEEIADETETGNWHESLDALKVRIYPSIRVLPSPLPLHLLGLMKVWIHHHHHHCRHKE